MHVAEIVGPVDDPEFAVAGCEIENLLVLGQHDECRKAQLGVDRNNILLAVLHDASAISKCGKPCKESEKQKHCESGMQLPFKGHGFVLPFFE